MVARASGFDALVPLGNNTNAATTVNTVPTSRTYPTAPARRPYAPGILDRVCAHLPIDHAIGLR